MTTEELLNTQAAAEYLTLKFPTKTAGQWALWLRNNRNTARRAIYRVPSVQIGRSAFYSSEDLARFEEWENTRQLGTLKLTGRAAEVMQAYGIGTASGGRTGRKLKVTGVNLQVDQATGKTYIQIIADDPLMVYRLELDEAKAIARELTETISACERINK